MSRDTEAEIVKAIENAGEVPCPLQRLFDEIAKDPLAASRPEILAALATLKQDDENAFEAMLYRFEAIGLDVAALNRAIFGHVKSDKHGRTQADAIVKIADKFELFHTPDRTAYADVAVEGHRETYPIAGKSFEKLLKAHFYRETSEAAASDAVRKALELLEARAEFDGPTREVYVRVAEVDEVLYVDLGNENCSVVEIRHGGWRVLQNAPVRFCRSGGALPLPMPEKGGSVEILRKYLNISRDEDFVLLVSWLLAALRYGGPYPVMVLFGEQGTAKSTTAQILRALIDPNIAPVRAAPRDERDLFVTAKHSHLLALDNLSSMPQWLSDSLCRLATHGAHGTRRLFTDTEEVLFNAQRPVILNGIEQMVTRGDLADRSIFLSLEPICSTHRVSERELLASFEKDRPIIFGALLEMMAHGLGALRHIKPEESPRMADFSNWAMACEGAQWRAGTFEQAYRRNREETVEAVVDADPVASTVQELMARTMRTMRTQIPESGRACPEWRGTASDLLGELKTIANETMQRDLNWPKSAHLLSNRLRRATPFLRERGIYITRTKVGHERTRMISITVFGKDGKTPSASSASSAQADNKLQSDGGATIIFVEGSSVASEESLVALGSATSLAPLFGRADAGASECVTPTKSNGIIVKKPKKKA